MQSPACAWYDFNPRSREGSDLVMMCHGGRIQHFNPRSREGSDQADCTVPEVFLISIHAPVKGATCIDALPLSLAADFNPRSREGSDAPNR